MKRNMSLVVAIVAMLVVTATGAVKSATAQAVVEFTIAGVDLTESSVVVDGILFSVTSNQPFVTKVSFTSTTSGTGQIRFQSQLNRIRAEGPQPGQIREVAEVSPPRTAGFSIAVPGSTSVTDQVTVSSTIAVDEAVYTVTVVTETAVTVSATAVEAAPTVDSGIRIVSLRVVRLR